MQPRILFIIKQRELAYNIPSEGTYTSGKKSSGLYNSVKFLVDELSTAENNLATFKMVEVVDNNSIDREVTAFQATHVIIEALWVVPEKFDVLTALHPSVNWYVRLHSDVPFISNEGIAFQWIFEYVKRGVQIITNSDRIGADLECLYNTEVAYLPNYYPIENYPEPNHSLFSDVTYYAEKFLEFKRKKGAQEVIDVGCFGAIRPLKNQLIQAIAAIEAADEMNLALRFHINADRIEGNGGAILKNIRNLFAAFPKHTLVEHDWYPHEEFLDLLKTMDISLQVSFSETYNIVAADSVAMLVPIVSSKEVRFINDAYKAIPTSSFDIKEKIIEASKNFKEHIVKNNYDLLKKNSREALHIWKSWIKSL